jgi:hypothetical protein
MQGNYAFCVMFSLLCFYVALIFFYLITILTTTTTATAHIYIKQIRCQKSAYFPGIGAFAFAMIAFRSSFEKMLCIENNNMVVESCTLETFSSFPPPRLLLLLALPFVVYRSELFIIILYTLMLFFYGCCL